MINVLLVDDHSVVRAGYKALLQSAQDIKVVAEAETGERGCQLYASLQPDVVVMDLSLPGIWMPAAKAISPKTACQILWSMQSGKSLRGIHTSSRH